MAFWEAQSTICGEWFSSVYMINSSGLQSDPNDNLCSVFVYLCCFAWSARFARKRLVYISKSQTKTTRKPTIKIAFEQKMGRQKPDIILKNMNKNPQKSCLFCVRVLSGFCYLFPPGCRMLLDDVRYIFRPGGDGRRNNCVLCVGTPLEITKQSGRYVVFWWLIIIIIITFRVRFPGKKVPSRWKSLEIKSLWNWNWEVGSRGRRKREPFQIPAYSKPKRSACTHSSSVIIDLLLMRNGSHKQSSGIKQGHDVEKFKNIQAALSKNLSVNE